MSEPLETPDHHRGGGFTTLACVLVFLVLLYPLSVAPAVRLSGGRLTPTLEAFYSPLEYLYDHVSPVHDFYEWYFRVWGVK